LHFVGLESDPIKRKLPAEPLPHTMMTLESNFTNAPKRLTFEEQPFQQYSHNALYS
jgi:hypothetical protein